MASLRDVIRMKEASNRPEDVAQLAALRQTLERVREREEGGQTSTEARLAVPTSGAPAPPAGRLN